MPYFLLFVNINFSTGILNTGNCETNIRLPAIVHYLEPNEYSVTACMVSSDFFGISLVTTVQVGAHMHYVHAGATCQ